jgi:putative redox protein
VSILQKKRVLLTRLELNVTAEEAETHPRVYTRIHVEYVFHGAGLREQDLERAIELSETKYCTVSAMLRPAVAITHSFRIVTPVPAVLPAIT